MSKEGKEYIIGFLSAIVLAFLCKCCDSGKQKTVDPEMIEYRSFRGE